MTEKVGSSAWLREERTEFACLLCVPIFVKEAADSRRGEVICHSCIASCGVCLSTFFKPNSLRFSKITPYFTDTETIKMYQVLQRKKKYCQLNQHSNLFLLSSVGCILISGMLKSEK